MTDVLHPGPERLFNTEPPERIDSLNALHELAMAREFELNTADLPEEDFENYKSAIVDELNEYASHLRFMGNTIEVTGRGIISDPDSPELMGTIVKDDFYEGAYTGFRIYTDPLGAEEEALSRNLICHELELVTKQGQGPGRRITVTELATFPVMDVRMIETPMQRSLRELQDTAEFIGYDDAFKTRLDEVMYDEYGDVDFKALYDLFDKSVPWEFPRHQLDTYLLYLNKMTGLEGNVVRFRTNCLLVPQGGSNRLLRLPQENQEIEGLSHGFVIGHKMIMLVNQLVMDSEQRQLYYAVEIPWEDGTLVSLVPIQHMVEDEN